MPELSKGAIMKAFGSFFVLAMMTFAAFSFSLATESTIACFDVTSAGGNITHIFVASTPVASVYSVTVDGEPVVKLYTDESPCEDVPLDVWFPLHGSQDTAHVCVSVQAEDPAEIEVSAKVNNECITGTTPLVSIELVE
jgi:hypothetical protein